VISGLFLKTPAMRLAEAFVDGRVVGADDGLGFVAPEMAGHTVPGMFFLERLLDRVDGVHFFRPQMFAQRKVHGVILSV